MTALLDAVDALLARPDFPPPAVRARLRRAAHLTQAQVGEALGVSRVSFHRWEIGRQEPYPQRREAYSRLLQGWAAKYPEAAEEADEADEADDC